jgi:hypothetical protein
MSQLLISRSADLAKLRNDGYDIAVVGGHLVMRDVPYVTPGRSIARGILISSLALAGDETRAPDTHVVFFAGEMPCRSNGTQLQELIIGGAHPLGAGLTANFQFSHKPAAGYPDYYAKMTAYATILAAEAAVIDPETTPMTFPVVCDDDPNSPFEYIDTASSRAGISAINERLTLSKVAIVGLGGTGGYILDLVAKTHVREIHLYDGDLFLQHNAFRAPGAPSREELSLSPRKVDYLKARYAPMRRGIFAHPEFVTEANVDKLVQMEFVFLALDGGDAKRLIVERLTTAAVPFVDVGMGIYVNDGKLAGLVSTTTASAERTDHLYDRIPFSDGDGRNAYALNIQIAELNALNATLAVIRWKKLFGVYDDFDREHYSVYAINDNSLTNEDLPLDGANDEEGPPVEEARAA